MVTPEEEVQLAQEIKKGNNKALDKLVGANLRCVVSVAKQYQNQGLNLSDLINEGNIGLIKAANKFDETRGFKFISYAVWWIRQTILQALAEQSRIVRLPLNQVGSINKINKEIQKFEQENERKPSTEELSSIINVEAGKISETMKATGKPMSIDAPLVNDEENSLTSILPNTDTPDTDKGLIDESLSKEIARSLSTLSEKECEKLLAEIQQLSLNETKLKNANIKKWRKVLSATKVLMVLKAESEFNRKTFREFSKH